MKLLKFYISLNFDGYGGHSVWVWAPPDWDEMTLKQQREFLDEQREQYLNDNIEYDIIVYPSYAAAMKASKGTHSRSNQTFDQEEVEDWYDSLEAGS